VVSDERQPALFRIRLSPGPLLFRYFRTVRGETRIPSFSFNSFAMRSSPQIGFSAAIFQIRSRRSLGKRGLPVGLDFQRQKSRNPLRCQRSSVSGFTLINASRHWNIRLRVAIIHRVESLARRGLTFRSWKSASCFRRKRFSAARALRSEHKNRCQHSRATALDALPVPVLRVCARYLIGRCSGVTTLTSGLKIGMIRVRHSVRALDSSRKK
jgi:hypothetical protein